jgi:acetate kinase
VPAFVGLNCLGIELNRWRNAAHAAIISTGASRAMVRVMPTMPTNDELMIARHVARLLRHDAAPATRRSD